MDVSHQSPHGDISPKLSVRDGAILITIRNSKEFLCSGVSHQTSHGDVSANLSVRGKSKISTSKVLPSSRSYSSRTKPTSKPTSSKTTYLPTSLLYRSKESIPHTSCASDGATTTHSPPKHLKGKQDQLLPYPLPSEAEYVWLTAEEWARICSNLGTECAWHLAESFWEYIGQDHNSAKAKRYKDHSRVLMNWHRRKIQNGYEFYPHPDKGHAYYREYMVNRFKEEARSERA